METKIHQQTTTAEKKIHQEAITKLKQEVPELCMWVYAARGLNINSGVPDTEENTMESMQKIITMLANEPHENILPSI